MYPLRALSFLGLALLLGACATNPVTGRQELVFMSPEREAAQGRDAAAQVEREIGLVRDPKLTAYVEQIGQRLAKHSPRHDVAYHFFVADMPEPNAFALPGGYIYVSRGLLALANSEDELAGVIAHEIGHVAARHAAQRETRQMGVGILSVLGTIAAGAMGGADAAQMASQLGQVAGAGMIASYGRDQERQADQIGQDLESKAGWDPAGLADFLTTLDREGKLRTGKSRNPSFLDSHPLPGERAVVARARAAELPRGAEARIARGHKAFLDRIAGVMVGANPEEGVFRDGLFLHPGLGFALAFPPKWQTQNTRQAVAAASPRRDAVIVFEGQGRTENPQTAAQRWTQANRVQVVESASTRIGGWPAFRALARAQGQAGNHRTRRHLDRASEGDLPAHRDDVAIGVPQLGADLRTCRRKFSRDQRGGASEREAAAPARRQRARWRNVGRSRPPQRQSLEGSRDRRRERDRRRRAAASRAAREDRAGVALLVLSFEPP